MLLRRAEVVNGRNTAWERVWSEATWTARGLLNP
jgi:hypothetical protein